jgi:hypothetical protein
MLVVLTKLEVILHSNSSLILDKDLKVHGCVLVIIFSSRIQQDDFVLESAPVSCGWSGMSSPYILIMTVQVAKGMLDEICLTKVAFLSKELHFLKVALDRMWLAIKAWSRTIVGAWHVSRWVLMMRWRLCLMVWREGTRVARGASCWPLGLR